MKKILITGGSGFIGKNLVEYLQAKYIILVPKHSELDLLNSQDVENYLRPKKVDIVIHAAVQGTLGKPAECARMQLKNNLRMFYNLKRCNAHYGKMYYFGSGAEYGKEAYISKMSEEYFGAIVPEDDYGLSKYIMADSIKDADNIFNLRIFGVFGAYENYNYRFISNCICKALLDRDIVIRQNINFDYLYIRDLCRIMEWILEHGIRYQCINVCRQEVCDIYSIARRVVQKTGSKSQIYVENEELGKEYSGSNQRLLEEMGGFHFTELDIALDELIAFYRGYEYELRGNY